MNKLDLSATRTEEQDAMFIEGYFAVFNTPCELWDNAFEEIDPAAFNNTMSGDIRALINHDTTLVLGRTKAGTLELKTDSRGLWGRIKINPGDSDAVNLYERVKRGDADQCSIGFFILKEETQWLDSGSVKWIIKEVELLEVSVCTFPAYEDTAVHARKAEYNSCIERKKTAKKEQLRERMKKLWL